METILGEKEQTERPMHAERQCLAERKEALPCISQFCWQKFPIYRTIPKMLCILVGHEK